MNSVEICSELNALLGWFEHEKDNYLNDIYRLNEILQYSNNLGNCESRATYYCAVLHLQIARCYEVLPPSIRQPDRCYQSDSTYKEAIPYLVRSAECKDSGFLIAQLVLARFYEIGDRPVEKSDIIKSIYYYRLALENPGWQLDPESVLPDQMISAEKMKTHLQQRLFQLSSGPLSKLQSLLQIALYPWIPLPDLANIIFTLTYESEYEVV
jgi:hypothetical protein